MNTKNSNSANVGMTSAQHASIMNAFMYLGYMLWCGPMMVVAVGMGVVHTANGDLFGVLLIGVGVVLLLILSWALDALRKAYAGARLLYVSVDDDEVKPGDPEGDDTVN